MSRRRASVVVGLLWCLAFLSVVVVGVLHTARLELLVVKNYGDTIQAHYLALAGVEKAKALLYRDAMERRRGAKNHSGQLYDAPQQFQDVRLGRGQFSVFRQGRRDEGGGTMYGVSDEESRLNLNQASTNELAKLYRATPEMLAAIIDWKDQDNAVTAGGAETDYYASLQPPSLPRNGPFQTPRELLMVRGISRELFLGEDANDNGLLDSEEDDGKESAPPDNTDGILDAGWSGMVTVDSEVRNVNAAGQDRVSLQSADEKTLASVRGISPEVAKAIVAYRGQKRLESLADLLDVTAVNPANQPPPAREVSLRGPTARPTPQNAPPPGPPAPQLSGEKLISENLLMEIADDLTTASGQNQPGAININTASVEVLACLPGVSQELAQAVVAYRKSAGFFPNIAWLLKVDGMTREVFKQITPKVSARSETFRILSEGRVPSTGARKRVQMVVRMGTSDIETLSYREDL